MADREIIDVHAHWYPQGCVEEVIRDHADLSMVSLPGARQDLPGAR